MGNLFCKDDETWKGFGCKELTCKDGKIAKIRVIITVPTETIVLVKIY